MNAAVAKQTVKQHFQALTDEQRHQYHLTHDCFTGRPLAVAELSSGSAATEDPVLQKQQRDLDCLNAILYPAPTLGNVLGDALAALKLQSQPKESVESTPLVKPSEDLVKRAGRWFDQYCAGGLAALLPAQSDQLTAANMAVIKRAFAHNTVLLRNVCMLSAFWIRSPLDWQAKGSTGLLAHLFVQYEVPVFLKDCWSQVADEDSVRWLLCYLMYAQGGSLKALAKHFGWTPVSKKLWHQLFICPAHLSPLHAVLYAEFKRLGGWAEDFACLLANESYVIDLLEPASEQGRDFWYDTCRWTISYQFELSAEENRKVLWWARHQLTELARRGETYRLQGRSKARVLESIAAYEQEQLQIQQARARMAERARQVSMARNAERERLRREYLEAQEMRHVLRDYQYGYYGDDMPDVSWQGRDWNWTTSVHGKQWQFIELTSSQELNTEGELMEHCVGDYSMDCLDGNSAIFSLRADGSRKVTIEIEPLTRYLIQAQGKFNAEPERAVMTVINAWMTHVVKR